MEDSTATVALVISIVALLATVGQLLQQYFATADGYRRCQGSVMGQWALRTRLRWRWRQFRFETLYTVPELYMSSVNPQGLELEGEIPLLGDATSRKLSMTVSTQQDGDRDELVDWVPLLHQIHITTRRALESDLLPKKYISDLSFQIPRSHLQWKRFPAIVMRDKSWDLQPPDAIRPLAKTTLSTIAIIARRMGMRWKTFRPEDGVMRAEGHSHTITSTMVRSVGLVLQYNYTGRGERLRRPSRWKSAIPGSVYREDEEIYIPSPNADRLGAGVVRGTRRLGLQDFSVNTQQEIIEALGLIDKYANSDEKLRMVHAKFPEFFFPVGDLMALTCSMMCLPGSPLVQVPAPSDNVGGITTNHSGFLCFLTRLGSFVQDPTLYNQTSKFGLPLGALASSVRLDIGPKVHEVLQEMQKWYSNGLLTKWDRLRRSVELLRYLNSQFDEATTYLVDECSVDDGRILTYGSLVGGHISFLVFGPHYNLDNGPRETQRWVEQLRASPEQQVESYFDGLPEYLDHLSKISLIDNKTLLLDIWVVMMYRGFCWGACHQLVEGERVPTAYFGSQLPVYIG